MNKLVLVFVVVAVSAVLARPQVPPVPGPPADVPGGPPADVPGPPADVPSPAPPAEIPSGPPADAPQPPVQVPSTPSTPAVPGAPTSTTTAQPETPEEQPTSPSVVQQDDATADPVTLPAAQPGLPGIEGGSNDVPIQPQAPNVVAVTAN